MTGAGSDGPAVPAKDGRGRLIEFTVFLAIFSAISGVMLGFKSLLLAPPYAVTVYLVVFHRGSSYARVRSIVAAYLFVIVTTEGFELTLGTTALSLVLNVIVVAAFITFTPYTHPPALALTIFSYIVGNVHDPVGFVLSSVLVLAIVAGADLVLQRWDPLARRPASGPTVRRSPDDPDAGSRGEGDASEVAVGSRP